jgi:hypothetical protein
MDTSTEIPSLERPEYFDGQRLMAADLVVAQDFDQELRWLHNRTLHAWGIALGLAVDGKRGDRSVTVQPGYALDSAGRELILTHPLTLAVPAVVGAGDGGPMAYYLTISYAEDADLPVSETRIGVCEGEGAVRRPEGALIRWQDPTDAALETRFRRGLDVILAAVQVENCSLQATPSTAERRDVRPARQPYIAVGASLQGDTVWTFWPDDVNPLGVQTTVDTSSGRFGATPSYTASVFGNRLFGAAEIADGFVTIVNPTPTSFALQLLMPRNLSVGTGYTLNPDAFFTPATLDLLQTGLTWFVSWMGVEG